MLHMMDGSFGSKHRIRVSRGIRRLESWELSLRYRLQTHRLYDRHLIYQTKRNPVIPNKAKTATELSDDTATSDELSDDPEERRFDKRSTQSILGWTCHAYRVSIHSLSGDDEPCFAEKGGRSACWIPFGNRWRSIYIMKTKSQTQERELSTDTW